MEGHRLWAAVYDSAPNPLLALESRTVQQLLGNARPWRVVDVGCGTGRWMRHFEAKGAIVTGVDASPEMLSEAARHPAIRDQLILGDAQALPIRSECADLVVCSFAASYIRNLASLVRELARITVRTGRVVVSDMHALAAAAKWTRSFRRGAGTYELDHLNHSPDDLCATAAAQGLRLEARANARFDEDDCEIFNRAGKQQLYCEVRAIPAVWVGIWTKL
jgi:malonyl-CoA O-methyltransferase